MDTPVGEYSRLPFDINTIRTIQFSRSAIGLISARDELILVLGGGLGGDYDPVTATRVWNETTSALDVPGARSAVEDGADGQTLSEPDGNERGFLDIMAKAEEHQEALAPSLQAVGECVASLGRLAEESSERIARSDASGKGMRGRLQVATRYAQGLTEIAEPLDMTVDRYVSVLDAFSAGTLALIGRMEDDPVAAEAGREFGMATRQMAVISRESMSNLAEMVDSIKANSQLSRVLREPSRRLTAALDRFTGATSIVDEWDRRLQSLGIPIPPRDWAPDSGEDELPDGGAAGNGDSRDNAAVEPESRGTADAEESEGGSGDESPGAASAEP